LGIARSIEGGEAVSDVQVSGAQPRRSWVGSLFGVIARLQTWKNMAYLALAFPLGLFYFVFLVVGLALGIGLVIIWVGLPILAVVVLAWWAFAGFERLQAEYLLGVRTAGRLAPWEGVDSWWQRVKRHLGDAGTWKDLSFLFVKFPLGVVSFVIVTLVVGVPAALISAPLYYRYVDWTTNGVYRHGINMGAWHVDTLPEALLLVPIGLVVLIAGLHLANVFAKFSGILAAALLDETGAASQPAQPATTPPQTPGALRQPSTPPQTPGAPPQPLAPLPTTPQPVGAPPEQATPPQAPAAPTAQVAAPQAPPSVSEPAPLPPVPPHVAGAPEAGN
jgi:hypothetical protein